MGTTAMQAVCLLLLSILYASKWRLWMGTAQTRVLSAAARLGLWANGRVNRVTVDFANITISREISRNETNNSTGLPISQARLGLS